MKPWWTTDKVKGLKLQRIASGNKHGVSEGDIVTGKEVVKSEDSSKRDQPELYIKENKFFYLPVNFVPVKSLNKKV